MKSSLNSSLALLTGSKCKAMKVKSTRLISCAGGRNGCREQDLDAIAAEILAALDGTLDDFIIARETEGQALKALIEQRPEGVSTEVTKVRAHMPEILQWQREASGGQTGRRSSAVGK